MSLAGLHRFLGLLALLALAACQTVPRPAPQQPPPQPVPAPPSPTPPPAPQLPSPPPQPAPPAVPLQRTSWSNLPDWGSNTIKGAWTAFMQSCTALKNAPQWQAACTAAATVKDDDIHAQQDFFEKNFQPYALVNPDGSTEGTITGYYEPLIKGSQVRTRKARYPIYGVPDDLVTVDLASVYPELKNMRLRGRLDGNRLVPYFSRSEINDPSSSFKAKPIAWADDPVELFFLQVQGSGRIQFPDGSRIRVGYANQNGYPYKSIGKILVDRGDMKLSEASMQSIKEWGRKNPDKLPDLLASNPSYVFFRVLPDGEDGPAGSLGVPLSAGYSIAVDPKYVPLGSPVYLDTTYPQSSQPLDRLVMAQDTGGAISGPVRADLFWGFGDNAGNQAGKMKQAGHMWVLLPEAGPPIEPLTPSP